MTNSDSRLDQITDRLDRITSVLQIVAETAVSNEQNIGQINTILAEITSNQQRQQIAIDALIEVQRNQQETTSSILNSMAIMQGEIREMQSDVRGLQTENRRILDRLENN